MTSSYNSSTLYLVMWQHQFIYFKCRDVDLQSNIQVLVQPYHYALSIVAITNFYNCDVWISDKNNYSVMMELGGGSPIKDSDSWIASNFKVLQAVTALRDIN